MIRQFRLGLLNGQLPDVRTDSDLFFTFFGDSPLARLIQRLEQAPAAENKPASGNLAAATPAADSPRAILTDPSALLPGTGVAVLDGPVQRYDGAAAAAGAATATSGRYQVFYLDNLARSFVVDTVKMELLPDHAQVAELGAGASDALILAGPFDGRVTLPVNLRGLETLLLEGGANYDLVASDDLVGRDARLVVDGMSLGEDESLRFDGTGERDGDFLFFGGAGDDTFHGGDGDDRILGGDGADTLAGGGGADVFAYGRVAGSTGSGYDALLDLNPSEDRIDLPVTVGGVDAAVRAGTLSAASFDGDLASAIGAARLGAGRAVLYAPNAGDLAGTVFLVVDANGQAGYQAGQDYVFALPGAAADLGVSAGLFV